MRLGIRAAGGLPVACRLEYVYLYVCVYVCLPVCLCVCELRFVYVGVLHVEGFSSRYM